MSALRKMQGLPSPRSHLHFSFIGEYRGGQGRMWDLSTQGRGHRFSLSEPQGGKGLMCIVRSFAFSELLSSRICKAPFFPICASSCSYLLSNFLVLLELYQQNLPQFSALNMRMPQYIPIPPLRGRDSHPDSPGQLTKRKPLWDSPRAGDYWPLSV